MHEVQPNPPFNPLDKKNLGISVADALLERPLGPLPPGKQFDGAGVYAIYYSGPHPLYSRLWVPDASKEKIVPIYVGKAVPEGSRKGSGLNSSPGAVLHRRLLEHAKSISTTNTLELSDFVCRYLIVDDIWIPLGEALLIEKFSPLWNQILDGFGSHHQGKNRLGQKRSKWDTIHPGRDWAANCQPNDQSIEEIERQVREYFDRRSSS